MKFSDEFLLNGKRGRFGMTSSCGGSGRADLLSH